MTFPRWLGLCCLLSCCSPLPEAPDALDVTAIVGCGDGALASQDHAAFLATITNRLVGARKALRDRGEDGARIVLDAGSVRVALLHLAAWERAGADAAVEQAGELYLETLARLRQDWLDATWVPLLWSSGRCIALQRARLPAALAARVRLLHEDVIWELSGESAVTEAFDHTRAVIEGCWDFGSGWCSLADAIARDRVSAAVLLLESGRLRVTAADAAAVERFLLDHREELLDPARIDTHATRVLLPRTDALVAMARIGRILGPAPVQDLGIVGDLLQRDALVMLEALEVVIADPARFRFLDAFLAGRLGQIPAALRDRWIDGLRALAPLSEAAARHLRSAPQDLRPEQAAAVLRLGGRQPASPPRRGIVDSRSTRWRNEGCELPGWRLRLAAPESGMVGAGSGRLRDDDAEVRKNLNRIASLASLAPLDDRWWRPAIDENHDGWSILTGHHSMVETVDEGRWGG